MCARGSDRALLGGPSTHPLDGMRPADTQRSTAVASVLAGLPFRRVVLWSHAVLALLSLLVFLNGLDLSHFAWWGRRASIALVSMGTPVLLPYAISAGHCWHLYTWQGSGPSRLRVAAFIVLLIIGAVAVDALLLGAFGYPDGFGLFFAELLVAQTWGYLWGAEGILEVI